MKGTMRGRGTEDNPYLVEDVYDFCAIKNDADKETTYYQLVNNIDFNDHSKYKNGITEKDIIYANASIIDGNGKSIRNIVWYNAGGVFGDTSFICKKMINCNFENLVISTGNNTNSAFETKFEKCSFYILCQNATFINAFCDNLSCCSFNDCTLNISGVSVETMSFSNTPFNRCYINFDNYTTPITGSSGSWYRILNLVNFDHVYLTGSLHCSNADGWGLLILDNRELFKNCYYCVKTTTINKTLPVCSSDGAVDAVSFYNKDLIHTTMEKEGAANFYALTDEQCKDPAYLASIGFPVIGV